MADLDTVITWLETKEKLVAQLAPSFVVDFDPSRLIPALRKLGFSRLTELTPGIAATNRKIESIIAAAPFRTYIAGACPTVTAFIKNKYPNFAERIVPGFSPMAAQAKINRKLWPTHKQIFIGPCLAKKTEARTIPELDLVLTFQELKQLLGLKGIELGSFADPNYTFDTPGQTRYRQYPISGALKPTLNKAIIKDWQIISVELIPDIKKVWEKYKDQTKKTILIDALSCPGGCIGGPGVISTEPTRKKRQQIIAYTSQLNDHSACKTGQNQM